MALTDKEREEIRRIHALDTRTEEQQTADNEKAHALAKRVWDLLAENAELLKTPEGIEELQGRMTEEEIAEWRQMSELGAIPGSPGGGFDVLYVADDGKDH